MTQSLFVGVDGGATKCTVRLEDNNGNLLGRETSGPANINLSVNQAWQSIFSALEKIILPLGISIKDKKYRWHAGMGLAGCEVIEAYQNFLEQSHPFETLVISSDAHIACLGAHAGNDGSIIIVGTGSVGFQVEFDQTTKISGWGFPHDDQGGGAWLGLEAVKITLQTLDGRLPNSNLAKAIYSYFNEDLDSLVTWANQANSTQFAKLAPIVIEHFQAGDASATNLIKQAAEAINKIDDALQASRLDKTISLPCSLIGGVASFVQPFLNETLQTRLVDCELTPDAGGILLVQHYLANLADEEMNG